MFPAPFPKTVPRRTPPPLRIFALCLAASAALFVGCSDGSGKDNLDVSLVGTWKSAYGDGYTITDTTVTYSMGAGSYVGEIKNAPDFSKNYGVIIIQYTEKPVYFDYGEAPDYKRTNPHFPVAGDFMGIYWKGLKATSVQMGNAYKYPEAEEITLEAAQNAFTLDNAGDYMSQYGVYTK